MRFQKARLPLPVMPWETFQGESRIKCMLEGSGSRAPFRTFLPIEMYYLYYKLCIGSCNLQGYFRGK